MPERGKRLFAAEAVILFGTLVAAAASSEAEDWQPLGLVAVLLALAIVSDLLALRQGSQRISGAFFAVVLAMALCGPAPAVLIGVVSVLVDSFRNHLAPHKVLTNTATYAVIPLVVGLGIEGLEGVTDIETNNVTFALVVFGAFVVSFALNFAMIAADVAVKTGIPIRRQVSQVLVPVLPVELATALLTVCVAIVYRETGLAAFALFALVLLVFQYVLRELLRSQRRAEELAALQLGALASMVDTLAMRDRMTARHSAAVARYARALAEAHGCSRAQQDLVHTAGLLHDIGKFSFPDSILLAPAPLTEEDWKIVRRHPEDGARVVARMEPYAPVAEIILGHHERWDGEGYPHKLAGEAIPLLSRMVTVADAYDVMIARDSYRTPLTSSEAIEEMRRVAGKQLDPTLVRGVRGAARREGAALPPRRRRRLRGRARLRAPGARVRAAAARVRLTVHAYGVLGVGEIAGAMVTGLCEGVEDAPAVLLSPRNARAVRRARGALPLGRGRRRQPGGGRRLRDARPVAAPAGRARDPRRAALPPGSARDQRDGRRVARRAGGRRGRARPSDPAAAGRAARGRHPGPSRRRGRMRAVRPARRRRRRGGRRRLRGDVGGVGHDRGALAVPGRDRRWLAGHGRAAREASRYVASIFAGVGEGGDLAELARSYATPGGINERFAALLDEAGVFDVVGRR